VNDPRGSDARGRRSLFAVALVVASAMLAALVPPAVAADGVATVAAVDDPTTVDDSLRSLQWYLDRIRAPQAWATTRGDAEVTIALIDTGVDPDHPDLDGSFWVDPATGTNGFDHLEGGFNTYRGSVEDWHGTAVAGVAVATADNAYGIAGVAPDVKLMVRRIYESTSTDSAPTQTSYSLAVEAIGASVEDDADVILITWGGRGPNAALEAAIRGAGVPVVAAAGNDGQDFSGDHTIERYPAMYSIPNLVTVAASDQENQLLNDAGSASNYGERHVDIAAPGDGIVSLVAGGDHGIFDGTSLAAPQVAAALALGRSVAPGTGPNELVGTLIGTARRATGLRGRVTSGGLLDVNAFLDAVQRPVCDGTYPPSTFDDVSRTAVHVDGIDCVTWYEVAVGVGDNRFAPHRTITRGEMATFIARTLDRVGYELPVEDTGEVVEEPAAPGDGTGDQTEEPPFTDIAGTTHEDSITLLAEAGIVSGIGDGLFAPRRTVTRAQMATFLVKTVELLLERDLVAGEDWFDDTAGSVHAPQIDVARELQITLGTSNPRLYDPDREVNRAQMASFMARTLDLLGREGVTVAGAP